MRIPLFIKKLIAKLFPNVIDEQQNPIVTPSPVNAEHTNKHLKNMDTESLLSKLKEIADDSTIYEISYGAMCYCPACRESKSVSCKCNLCKSEIGDFDVDEYADLVKVAGRIKQTGIAEIKIVCIDCLVRMCQSGLYQFDISQWDIYDSLKWTYSKCTNVDPVDIGWESLLQCISENQKQLREHKDDDIEQTCMVFKDYKYTEPEYLVFIFKPTDCDKPHLTVTYSSNLDYFLAFINNKRSWKSDNVATILLRDNIDTVERLTGLKL